MAFLPWPTSSCGGKRRLVLEPGQRIEVVGLAGYYLSGRDELKRSQGRLKVGDVGLEFVESGCNGGFSLGWVLPRRAVDRYLIESGTRHDCSWIAIDCL
jgi:hypothetical protein